MGAGLLGVRAVAAPVTPQPVPPLSSEVDLAPTDTTASQMGSNQLDQLFSFETAPNKSDAREGYLTAEFSFAKYAGLRKEFRETLQGEYGITDQIAAGAFIPVVATARANTHAGLGDVTLFGQYKFDKIIDPAVVNVTAQLDVVLPTGDRGEDRDTGRLGVRPLLLVYKDFGRYHGGEVGAYGVFGGTISSSSDIRTGAAITYEVNRVSAIVELFDQTGQNVGKPLLTVTPGFSFRQIDPWELVVGFPLGLNQNSPHWGVTVKLTYAFGN